jgi:hypothetical protein
MKGDLMAKMLERLDPGICMKIDGVDESSVDVEDNGFDHMKQAQYSLVSSMLELEEQDRAREHERDTVCGNDGNFTFQKAVGQPQGEAGDEHQKHLE